jgi:arabinose-5-phosphate isomerase
MPDAEATPVSHVPTASPTTDADMLARAAEVVRRESAAVAALADRLPATFTEAVRLMFECRGHVIVSGSGTSHAVALRFAHLLSCCGTPALFLHPGDSQHGAAGAVRDGDVWVGLSKGGETAEVCFLAGIARKRRAAVIAITEQPASTLGRLADVVLEIAAPADVDPYGMIATGSSLFNSAFCDALCIALLDLRGYTRDAFGETHPGGAVGHKLRASAPARQERASSERHSSSDRSTSRSSTCPCRRARRTACCCRSRPAGSAARTCAAGERDRHPAA